MIRIALAAALALVLAASAAFAAGAKAQPTGWKALLIAGDDEEPAFDNAVDAMADKLAGFGVPRANISILKASDDGAEAATTDNIKAAFAALDPAAGEGCFLFVTSHGTPARGLVMTRAHAFLSPRSVAILLDRSCGTRPTVVIASGCFSGVYAEDYVPAANRVILTAARDDRPSFGCNASLKYTIFDRCILASLRRGFAWREIMARTRTCVSGNEFDFKVKRPSEPQLSIGAAETRLLAFTRQGGKLK